MELVHVLECAFNHDALGLALEINDLMDGLFILIQILYEANDAIFLMVLHMLDLVASAVLKDDGQIRVQVGGLMKSALDLLRLETGLLKDLRIRQKINLRTGLAGAAKLRKQTFLQFNGGDTPLVMIMMYVTVPADFDIQIGRKSVDNRGSHTIETAAGLVYRVIELSARMQGREYQTLSGYALGMHVHRDATSIVRHGTGSVLLQKYIDFRTEACQMLVHGIVHNLVDQMVQAFAGHASDIHTGSFAHCLQSLQDRNTACIVGCRICHVVHS